MWQFLEQDNATYYQRKSPYEEKYQLSNPDSLRELKNPKNQKIQRMTLPMAIIERNGHTKQLPHNRINY